MVNDPIADLLIRIKNGYLNKASEVKVPPSKFKLALLKKLVKLGYINDFSQNSDKGVKIILKYNQGIPVVQNVLRLSKPGLRKYIGSKSIRKLQKGLGYYILSTPKGLKTHTEAKKENLGGELVCKIW